MRYLLLFACVGAASLVLAQGRPRVPAHFRNSSVTTDRAFVGTLYVDGGATWAGSLGAPAMQTEVLDAGQVWAGTIGNPDGGRLHVPAGVLVESGASMCFNGTTCTQRIRSSGANVSLEPGTGRFVVTDGATLNTDIQAGNTSANGVNLSGGSTAATLRVSGGAAPTPDAGLRLEAGGPNGLVEVVRDAGISSRAVRYTPYFFGTAPACTQANVGETVHLAIPIQDGGVRTFPQFCNGTDWIVAEQSLPIYSPAKSGSGVTYYLSPEGPFRVRSATPAIQAAGLGAATFEVMVRQGANVLCRGAAACTIAAPQQFQIDCTGDVVYVSPDGGVAHLFVVELDGGCANTPAFTSTVNTQFLGHPGPGWTP